MPRFFVAPENLQNGRFRLTGAEARHAAHVLRKKVGDVLELFDGKNLSFEGRIEAISDETVSGVIEREQKSSRPVFDLTLAQGLIKGPKWDWLIEKACEIGVQRLVPLATARAVVRIDPDEAVDKVARWNRIALAASKQCGRSSIMEVAAPASVDDFLRGLKPEGFYLIPWEKESARRISDVPKPNPCRSAALMVGPEGGWENAEVERAERHGVVPVMLGPTLLRSETAGVIASVLILRELGLY